MPKAKDNYLKSLNQTIEMCDLIIAHAGSHEIPIEQKSKAEKLKKETQENKEKYLKLKENENNKSRRDENEN